MRRSAARAAPDRKRGLTLVLTLSTIWALGISTDPASAQTDDADVRLTVTSMTTTVGPGSRPPDAELREDADDLQLRVLIENAGTDEFEDLTLSVEVFGGVETRSELHRALDDGGRPARLRESRFLDVADGEALEPGEVAALEVTVEASSIGWGDQTAVHPVSVSVLSGRVAVDTVTTGVVALASQPEQPLPTVIGWPIDGRPRDAIADTFDADLVDAAQPGGRLERLVWTLEQHPDLPVQLLSSAHVAEDLEEMGDGYSVDRGDGPARVAEDDPRSQAAAELLERLRTVVADRDAPVAAAPYADADLAALHGAGFTLDAVREVVEGRSRLEATLGERPLHDGLWATTPLTAATLREVLDPAGIDRVLLAWDQLAIGQGRPARTPPPMHTVRSGGIEVTTAVADPWLQDLLEDLPSEHGTALAVQRILAETAQAHLEQPGATQGRGIVLLPPQDWDPSPRVAEGLLSGLSRAPWLRPLSLDELGPAFGSIPERTQLDPSADAMSPDLRSELQRMHSRLAALQDAVTDEVDGVGGHSWRSIEAALQRVPSGWWLDSGTQAQRLLASVDEVLDEGFGIVRLPPDARVTLTDAEGHIPVTVSRPEGPPIQVIVQLDAPKLDLAEDARFVTLAEGSQQTISFPAVAQASGRIPVTVRVKTPGAIDPAGAPWIELATETIVVQSTVFSGTALVILGAILLLLLGWWLYRRWRPPSPRLTVVRDEAA